LKRLLDVFVGTPQGVSASVAKIFKSLYYSSASVVYPYPDEALAKIIFLGVVIFAIWKLITDKKDRSLLVLFLFSIVIPGVVFVFWRQNFSEYYLMSAIPSFIFLTGYVYYKYKGERDFIWAIIVFFLLMNIISWMEYKRPLNLAAKRKAVEFILSKAESADFGVSLSVDDGYQFGYKYIFSSYGVEPDIPPLKDQKEIYTIVVPPGWKGIQAKVEFDGVGVLWR
jgi:4-amino-4-deoxy-L-arabinose transferase-like glycosyltransferase